MCVYCTQANLDIQQFCLSVLPVHLSAQRQSLRFCPLCLFLWQWKISVVSQQFIFWDWSVKHPVCQGIERHLQQINSRVLVQGIWFCCSWSYFELKTKKNNKQLRRPLMSCLKCNRFSHMSQNECIHLHVCFSAAFHTGAPQGFTLAPVVFAMQTFHWRTIQGSLCAPADKMNLSFERHTLYCPSRLTHSRNTVMHETELNPFCSNVLFHPFAY